MTAHHNAVTTSILSMLEQKEVETQMNANKEE
jgi:hypothetical protein